MSSQRFSHQLTRLSQAEATALQDHPDAEELVAYDEGRLGEKEATKLQEHLSLCRQCAATVLDLKSFSNVELRVSGYERTEVDVAADWQLIQDRLAVESPRRDLPATVATKLEDGDGWMPWIVATGMPSWAQLAATAVLAMALGVLAQRYWVLWPQDPVALSPQANVRFLELLTVDDTATRSAATESVSLPAAASSLVLIMTSGDFGDYASFEARLEGGAENESWKIDGLIRAADGSFSLELPRSMLTSGTYRLELRALASGMSTRIATYQFDLELD